MMTVCSWNFWVNLIVATILPLMMFQNRILGGLENTIGFYCNDPKISHMHTGDSIPITWVAAIALLLPIFVIWPIEWMFHSSDSYKNFKGSNASRSHQLWRWYGYYFIGLYYVEFMVDGLSEIVKEPRPDFLDSCRPKEMFNCSDGTYVQSYTCTNTELSRFSIINSDKSFPSGHSALSMFSATFLVWYLQNRIPDRAVFAMIKPLLQCLVLICGFGCGISRVTDHRHHWWDVGFSWFLGIVFGIFIIRICCKNFRPDRFVSGTQKFRVSESSQPAFDLSE